ENRFRYFLAVETARARRALRPFLVLAVEGRNGASAGRSNQPAPVGPNLLTVLAGCLRESDLVGWHRANRRAAALLTETAVDPHTARFVGAKVLRSLSTALPPDLARSLRVKIYRSWVPGERVGLQRLFAASGAGEGMCSVPDQGVSAPKKGL